MKQIIQLLFILFIQVSGNAQPNIYPSPANNDVFYIVNATLHVGNGKIIENGIICINKNKIEKTGINIPIPSGAKIYDVKGKQVYPGLISPITNLGLKEVAAGVRATNDYNEIGIMNPSIRSIVAYNSASNVINVLRSNGILLANVIPQDVNGSRQLISGTSSVVQLDAWNYEDAVYKMDGQMHFNMPGLQLRRSGSSNLSNNDPTKLALQQIENVKAFFREANAYLKEATHTEINLNFEATKNLSDRKQQLFVHCNAVKEMLLAIDFIKEFNFKVVIVGGADSWKIAPILKENNIPVILSQAHSLPTSTDDDIDQPFKTPYLLQKAGVLFAISDNDGNTRGRNLMFNAGTAAAYGLTKEEALSAITLNPAKILGIDQLTGTLEEGKDANIIVSDGDILDMEKSIVELAFIQGRKINLDNRQSQLAERYRQKYNIK